MANVFVVRMNPDCDPDFVMVFSDIEKTAKWIRDFYLDDDNDVYADLAITDIISNIKDRKKRKCMYLFSASEIDDEIEEDDETFLMVSEEKLY